MHPITIRPSTEDDWSLLKDIRLAALLDSPKVFNTSYAKAAARDEAAWRHQARTDTQPKFWLALSGNQAVGMIGGFAEAADECHLIAMWVHPEFRRTGAAGRLVETVKIFARERAYPRVALCVAPENLAAVRLYSRHGFVFQDEWEFLESHPDIRVQKMSCLLEPS
jgi:ribosomal protein S18 acetylase RimI-like enzyme